jgi:hypothetical protein
VGLARPNVSKNRKALRNTLHGRQSTEENQPQLNNTSNVKIEGGEFDATSQIFRDALKQPKFGLFAKRQRNVLYSALQLSNKADLRYYEAKKEELEAHKEKGTWKVVPLPEGVRPVTSRWVNTEKYRPDGQLNRHKSRLVARSF